eukprot:CAMPEP_0194539092 /NCGR_PEP_ID=MMETSP0253-20130528/78937_1 /TAXON_ID=2966 /ORGANISM="Noctiluca scintillans" /LENGTH=30 /DNA_ID= /DNA_START= /DNA_END= /DNA_ORIENTATION=
MRLQDGNAPVRILLQLFSGVADRNLLLRFA